VVSGERPPTKAFLQKKPNHEAIPKNIIFQHL
jgi:hypothetical protein